MSDGAYNAFAENLGRKGLSVWPDFLSPELLTNTRTDLETLRKAGRFKEAGVGHGADQKVRETVRRNELCWLEEELETLTQALLMMQIEHLKHAFNQTLFLGLKKFEGHYTVYPKNGFYERHLDNSRDGTSRVISLILYLSPAWIPEHGGELRVYQGTTHTDIAPVGGTLVCFASTGTEHEVLPTNVERPSFTGWFLR